MSNLTIRLNPEEKARLKAWAAVRGASATEYIKALVAADMAAGNAHERVAAWFRENEAAIAEEAEQVQTSGVSGSHLALNRPWPESEVYRFRDRWRSLPRRSSRSSIGAEYGRPGVGLAKRDASASDEAYCGCDDCRQSLSRSYPHASYCAGGSVAAPPPGPSALCGGGAPRYGWPLRYSLGTLDSSQTTHGEYFEALYFGLWDRGPGCCPNLRFRAGAVDVLGGVLAVSGA